MIVLWRLPAFVSATWIHCSPTATECFVFSTPLPVTASVPATVLLSVTSTLPRERFFLTTAIAGLQPLTEIFVICLTCAPF